MPLSSQEGRPIRKAAEPPMTRLSWNEIKDRAYRQAADYFLGLKLPEESARNR